jgi:hypothetical protein
MRYNRHNQFDENRVSALKVAVTKAFGALRKQGFVARQSFMCCGGCSGGGMATLIKTAQAKGKTIVGGVWYHTQDTDCMKETGKLFLRYSEPETGITINTKEVGEMVVAALTSVGLTPEWDGDPSQCIIVMAPELPVEPAKLTTPVEVKPATGTKPVCKLLGTDGNVFALGGRVSRTLKDAGLREQATEFTTRMFDCGSYDEALQLMMQYVDVR